MKVYGAKRYQGYSGGVMLVAANSLEEALLTAASDPDSEWIFHWYDEDYNDHQGDLKYLASDVYPMENWFEVNGLSWNGDKPTVIIENGYSE